MARKNRRVHKPYPAPPIEFEYDGATHTVQMRDLHGSELAQFAGLDGDGDILSKFESISEFIQFFVYSIDGQKPENFPISLQARAGQVAQADFLEAWAAVNSGSTIDEPMSETDDSHLESPTITEQKRS